MDGILARHRSRKELQGLAQTLEAILEGKEFVTSLFGYIEGKFAKLFQARPDANPTEGIHAVCYDFLHLKAHDLHKAQDEDSTHGPGGRRVMHAANALRH